jgi:hypothetical protein
MLKANRKDGFVRLPIVIVLLLVLGGAFYFVFKTEPEVHVPISASASSTPLVSATPSVIVATSSEAVSPSTSDVVTIYLDKPFLLKKNQVAKLTGSDFELEINNFYNSPCPKGAQCIWSGIGVGFEYRNDGQIKKGVNLAQAFGYETTILETDYKTYARLSVSKMKQIKAI